MRQQPCTNNRPLRWQAREHGRLGNQILGEFDSETLQISRAWPISCTAAEVLHNFPGDQSHVV